MANVNANINVNIQTQQAAAQLRKLSADISRFNQQTFAANSAAAQQQRALNQALIDGVRTSGQFRTSIVPMTSAVENFSNSIEKGKLTLGQYTRYAASQLPGMRRVFTREFDMINRVAEKRVRTLNTQFIALGESANGMRTALAMTPTALDQFSARSAIALQRQQIFNRLLRDGSTQLLNWGKNTQWAGRQLMVGFTIPLGLLGAQAAKVFRELEAEAINFKKVYGDMFTTDVEVEKNLAAIKELSMEMTKYGQTAQQTMQLANTAAQSGARGAELMAATRQATRLAILGQMEQNQAIETTISLQTAFSLSNEELAESINFLNSVENQTILSLQDVSEAIPRVASVIKGFGGDVQDLSVLLVAMKEGGVSAAEGANALKNSMARVIAPTKRALETSAKYGIALQDIVARNEGKVVPLFQELARALEAVGGQERQEILSDIFGKFQYARIGTLLSNIAKDGSQAAKAIELTGVASRDLAATAERELSAVEDAVGTKFTAALEKAKVALAPVGEEFLKALTPVLDAVGKILGKFDELPGGLKTAIVAATAIIGGIAPIVLMVTGLVANGIANIGKFILFLRKQVGILRGNGEQFKFYSSAELEAAAAAASLEGKTSSLTRTMLLQRPAIETLITLYQRLASSAAAAAVAMPATMGGVGIGRLPMGLPKGGLPTLPQARNMGGPIFMADGKRVPGSGNTDKVPAMLTPGEYVVNKQASQSNLPLLEAINSGNIVRRNKGGIIPGVQHLRFGGIAGLRMPKPITNPNQQRAVESQLTNWLDMQMRKTNVRELGKLLGRRQKDTELYRGMKMRPSDSGYENRFPKETQDALYRFAKTGNPEELSGLIGRPVAIAPRSFSTSEKVARTFAGDPVNVGNVKKDAAPLILKLKNQEGVFGFKPTERIGDAKQSKRFVKEKRFYSRGSQNEREIVPVGDPRTGARVDAVVGRWGFDGKNVFIDTGAKLSRRELSSATKEFDTFTASRFTPTADIVKANKDLQRLEAAFHRAKRNQGRTSSKELGDLGAQLLSQSNVRFNAGTRKDKRLADSIAKRTAKMLEETSVMFNRAKSLGLNKGGMAPEMAPTISAPLVKEWAQRKAGTLTDTVTRQSSAMKANRGRIVPGTGNTDTVPAMLTPGEFVVNKEATQQNLPLIKAINDGKSVSYLNEGDQVGGKRQSGTYSSRGRLSSQTGKMTWATLDSEIREAKKAMKGWNLTEKQVKNALQKSASHIVQGEGRVKNWVSRNLTPDLQAINQYMNRVPKVAAGILKETQTIEKIAKTTGLSTARVTQELNNFQKGIHPITQKSASVMRQVALIDERMSKTAISAGKKTMAYGLPAQGGYQASAVRAILREREKAAPGKGFYQTRGERRYNIPAGGFSTVRGGGTPIPTPKPSAPAPTVRQTNTPLRQSAAQQLAREIRKSNPRLTSAQSLNLARLQLGRGQKQAIAGLQGMGGGGGRTPTFLGMPGMPEQPRQSMYSRMNAGVGKFGMGAGMGLSMAAMLPMMKQDEQGKFMGMDSGTAMMGLMGGGMLLSIAPMLGAAALPVIALGATAAAVGLGLKAWRNSVDDAAKKTAELGANMGGTANALNTMASLFGERTPTQRRTQLQLGFTAEEQEQSFGEFQNYLGSEQGQKFIKDLENATSADRFTKLSSYLANAVAGGILDEEKAKLFAKTVASSLNDAVLGSSVIKAIEDQKAGAEGLLELAEKRLAAVEKSGAMQRLQSEATIEETDASSVIGSSIQIIQDFANVEALAKEEYAAGIQTFAEYRETVNRARSAQEEYTRAMESAFIKTEDFGATMQGWKDQLLLSGKDKETVEAFQRSSTMTQDPTSGMFENIASYITPTGSFQRGFQATRQLFGGQATFGNVANAFFTGAYQEINEELLSAMTAASLSGEYSDADINAIAAKIIEEPQGQIAQVFEQYGRGERGLGRALFEQKMQDTKIPGLDEEETQRYIDLAFRFDESSGDIVDFEAFIANIPEEIRPKIIMDLEGLTAEGMSRIAADQARFAGMFGMETANEIITESPEYLKNIERTGRVVPRRGRVEYDETLADELTRLYENLGSQGAESVSYARGAESDLRSLSSVLSNISETIEYIEKTIPKDVQIGLGIDIADPKQMDDLNKYKQALGGLASVVSVMTEEEQMVAARIAVSIVDGENKPLTAEQLVTQTAEIINAIKKLDSKDLNVRNEAILTIVQSYENEDGSRITPEQSQQYLDKWKEEFGEKRVSALNYVDIGTIVNLETQIKGAEETLSALRVAMSIAYGSGDIAKAEQLEKQIQDVEAEISGYNASKKITFDRAGSSRTTGGSSGGGGSESPLKGFVQGIIDQVKMWTDATASVEKLNSLKGAFANVVMKGQGIFDKLKNIKGITGGQLQEILGLGPKGIQEFIKKYVKNGNLTQQGLSLLRTATRTGANQTIAENVIGTRIVTSQSTAARIAKSSGASKEVVEEIAQDPAKSAQLVQIQEDIKNKVDGAKKKKKEFIESEEKAIKAAQRLQKELDPAQFQIDKMSEEFDQMMAPLRAIESEFQMEFGKIERAYRQRIEDSEKIIKGLQKQIDEIEEEIDALEKLNRADQNRIRDLERQKEMLSRQLEQLDRANELDQRRIETLQREDEIRTRVEEALSRELELMSRAEEDIRDSYQKRIDALDEVAKVNDYILNQQRQQLDLSRAISEGDIYAATAAAQEMRASSAGFAVDQVRQGLETGMENQIAGLRTSEGLTREQAEERIRQIQDQSYQTSLQIRDIEDAIYNRNLQMIPIKDQIRNYDLQIRDIQDQIYNRETEILNIQNTRIEPLQAALDNENKKLLSLQDQMETEKSNIEIQGMKYGQLMDQIGAQEDLYNWSVAQIKANQDNAKTIAAIGKNWRSVAKQINQVNKAALDATKTANLVFEEEVADVNVNYNKGLITKKEAQEKKTQASQELQTKKKEIEDTRVKNVTALREGGTTYQQISFANKKKDNEPMTTSFTEIRQSPSGVWYEARVESQSTDGGKTWKEVSVKRIRDLANYTPPKQASMSSKKFAGGIANPTRLTSNEAPPPQRRSIGGSIFGNGTRDSIPAMLTPGEFVIRKAMVDKYGIPMMESLNQGSFSMPRYSMPENTGGMPIISTSNMTSISAPVYNTYDMKFSINGANQSADEIANKVMFKMKQLQNQQIRGNRGY